MEHILFAFSLTLLAGLSTGIGSALAFFTKKVSAKFLSTTLGFSAGVMIYVSLTELLPESQAILEEKYTYANIISVISFFAGVLLIGLIDSFVPDIKNPHEIHKDKKDLKKMQNNCKNPRHLFRIGLLTALALALHNLPEGLATFISALNEPTIAYSIAFAIAIHNIPEGIAVYVPILYATRNRKKAFLYSFASGLAEPIGAILGYLILKPFLSDTLFGVVFAMVAGIMVYVSFDELLPTAEEYGEHHLAVIGLFAGMMIMAISLILF